MSSRFNRPRRTRLYDAAYRAGESYYKPALDDLDKRRLGRTSSPAVSSTHTPSRIKFDLDSNLDAELQDARSRAHRAITEEPSLFDSRGHIVGRSQQRAIANASAYLDGEELGEESSLSRIRANRQNMRSLIDDLDLDDSFSTIKRRANIDLGEKLMQINKSGEEDYGIKSRGIKLVSGIADVDSEFEPEFKSRTRKLIDRLGDESGELDSTRRSVLQSFRKTVITSDESATSSAAAKRAQETKTRLANLETDIMNRQEKLHNHEARSARLRNFMAENDIESIKKEAISF
ncbi:uncharacterized protein LOC129610147 isoform X2 [Condylostylus longicornis]|uniref:uncharacterized protein LOC129610147 isoform X2 n=1 Tax=Condylostylus longicornis TaxID=2530218 RepID=UPI00244DE526|nr:uncharacterized protein LOC129610147 isoform X2 [Condylostylus longicornis]